VVAAEALAISSHQPVSDPGNNYQPQTVQSLSLSGYMSIISLTDYWAMSTTLLPSSVTRSYTLRVLKGLFPLWLRVAWRGEQQSAIASASTRYDATQRNAQP